MKKHLITHGLASLALLGTAHAGEINWTGFGSVHMTAGQIGGTQVIKEKTSPHLDLKGNSKMGLNLNANVNEGLNFTAQMVANGAEPEGVDEWSNWDLQADWLFLKWQVGDNLQIKAGRQLYNAWIAAEYVDVGALLPWRVAPTQVYSLSPFKSFEGVSFDFFSTLGDLRLKTSLFGGALHNNRGQMVGEAVRMRNVDGDNLVGVVGVLEGKHWQARASASRMNYEGSFSYSGSEELGSVSQSQDYVINEGIAYTLGFRYSNEWILWAEYGHTIGTGTSDFQNPYLGGATKQFGRYAEGYYVTTGRHFGKWLPHLTYAYGNYRMGYAEGEQKSYLSGLNYQAFSNAVVKFAYEVENATGTGITLNQAGATQILSVGVDFLF